MITSTIKKTSVECIRVDTVEVTAILERFTLFGEYNNETALNEIKKHFDILKTITVTANVLEITEKRYSMSDDDFMKYSYPIEKRNTRANQITRTLQLNEYEVKYYNPSTDTLETDTFVSCGKLTNKVLKVRYSGSTILNTRLINTVNQLFAIDIETFVHYGTEIE